MVRILVPLALLANGIAAGVMVSTVIGLAPMSLAVPYRAPGAYKPPSPYRGALVRFSIGLEAVEDLLADLEQALAALPG